MNLLVIHQNLTALITNDCDLHVDQKVKILLCLVCARLYLRKSGHAKNHKEKKSGIFD
jgi:hypothetical protein